MEEKKPSLQEKAGTTGKAPHFLGCVLSLVSLSVSFVLLERVRKPAPHTHTNRQEKNNTFGEKSSVQFCSLLVMLELFLF